MLHLSAEHSARWCHARNLLMAIVVKAETHGALIRYQDEFVKPDQFVFDDLNKRITIVDGRATYIVYDANPELDHGSYDSEEFTEAAVREAFKLYKPVEC